MIKIILNNLISPPIIFFISGYFSSFTRLDWLFRPKLHALLTYFILFSIGLKGGLALIHHSSYQLFYLLATMIAWGLIQPFISYWLLKRFSKTDTLTAAAIASCFGSVSVMTFAAATAFLEKLDIHYETFVIAVLTIMEVPAILSGLYLSKSRNVSTAPNVSNIWAHTFFNKSIVTIFFGIVIGMISYQLELSNLTSNILLIFKPSLCVFLLNMGILIGKQKKDLNQFSWSLSLFGFYMPLIGGAFGIIISYLFGLDAGTATLIAILSASASYIAVPAAMKIAIPQAKEAVYLPLSLGIAFPFNVIVGIPVFYFLATKLLT